MSIKKFPPWMKKKLVHNGKMAEVTGLLNELKLNTVCRSARCPNANECYNCGTATFMILGDICTRNCNFCAVTPGTPLAPDPTEPDRIAQAVKKLGLKHAVVTSVTRDDLPDGGAGHFAATIKAIKEVSDAFVEVLTPDFEENIDNLKIVIDAKPDIFNHNLETVPRLYKDVRPQAIYERSLNVLAGAKKIDPDCLTKSGLMVGLGETFEEVVQVMKDLREINCDYLTIGQYLQPTDEHHELVEFVTPETFEKYGDKGKELGFTKVFSAPFVRSSYMAEQLLTNTANEI